MYYQNYEDYMRSILGYPVRQNENMDTYENYNINNYINSDYSYQTPRYSDEIINLYPEIYKIINPMVCKLCDANTKPIDNDLLEKMTEEIYLNIESDPSLTENGIINVRVNLPKENSNVINTTSSKSTSSSITSTTTSRRLRDNKNEKNESRVERDAEPNNEKRENRQFGRNSTLRDLIRILILNRLLGRDIRRPRPHMPPRPPFPGGPGPNPRPPMQPRDLYGSNQYLANRF